MTTRTRPPAVHDSRAVRDLRHVCEMQILQLLAQLVGDTGLDLDRVQVLTIVKPKVTDGEPQVVPYAVKIVLCV